MQETSKFLLKLSNARAELTLLCVTIVILIASGFNLIPSMETIGALVFEAFVKHGIALVAACSILEGIVGINTYFPGSFTILVAMSTTAGDPIRGLGMFVAITISAFVANIVSFLIGTTIKSASPPPNSRIFWLTYWHPQFASLTAFQAGASGHLSLMRFFKQFTPPLIIWNTFWAILMYNIKLTPSSGSSIIYIFLIYLIVAAAYKIKKNQ